MKQLKSFIISIVFADENKLPKYPRGKTYLYDQNLATNIKATAPFLSVLRQKSVVVFVCNAPSIDSLLE